MSENNRVIEKQQLERQNAFCQSNAAMLRQKLGRRPIACVNTFGCQQNEADSELIRAMLFDMDFDFCDSTEGADLIIFNTCAIREHAEMRVFGNVGETSHIKKANPNAIICVCGCMVQQQHVADKIKNSFPYVDLVFGTHALYRFPELLSSRLNGGKRIFDLSGDEKGVILEGISPVRKQGPAAWLSIMYGCNNYCTYCVVPYVRGRERSRSPEAVVEDFKDLIAQGYKDITLLGQNVNSYGSDQNGDCDFSQLLEMLDAIPGDHRIRFMTSHPKDATKRLFDTMAKCKHVCHSIHLPVQAGNDKVLSDMNRGYTSEKYIELVNYARSIMPDLTVTSDIIVGFPGESESEFEHTLDLLKTVRFDSLFTFIYSSRKGTKAAEMQGHIPRDVQQNRFDRLLEVQNIISREINEQYVGKKIRVLVDGFGGDEHYPLSARTDGFKLVHVIADEKHIGNYIDVIIEKRSTWALFGRMV